MGKSISGGGSGGMQMVKSAAPGGRNRSRSNSKSAMEDSVEPEKMFSYF